MFKVSIEVYKLTTSNRSLMSLLNGRKGDAAHSNNDDCGYLKTSIHAGISYSAFIINECSVRCACKSMNLTSQSFNKGSHFVYFLST